MLYKDITDTKKIMQDVKKIIIDRDLKQKDIANKMCITKQTISNMLNAKTLNITLDTLLQLCNAIDCDLYIEIRQRDITDSNANNNTGV